MKHKNFFLLLSCITLLFLFSGCGKQYEEEQKAVVDQYFTYLKEYNLEELKKISEENSDANPLLALEESFEPYYDADTFGQEFVDAAKSYVELAANLWIDSYEYRGIEKSESNDKQYLVRLNAQARDYSTLPTIYNLETTIKQYQQFNQDELQAIYDEEGETAALHKIYAESGKTFFGQLKSTLKTAKPQKISMTIVLEQKDDTWKIVNLY